MAVRMYRSQFFGKLFSHLKSASCVRNYSKKESSVDDDRPEPSITVNIFACLHRENPTWKELQAMHKWKVERQIRDDQRFIPEKHKFLGPDIAAAHFVTCCGGKIKFHGSNVWMAYESIAKNEIPSRFVPKMFLEAIDASDTFLCYEGFENFTYLPHVKEILLRNCPYIDDWCLHRLNMFEDSLECLDISGCQNVSDRGICTLHNLKSLKLLTLNNTPKVENKELVCLLLQEVLPQLKTGGVDYSNPSLWERLKEYLN